jgi:cell wall-associated NlpC family hydrolase
VVRLEGTPLGLKGTLLCAIALLAFGAAAAPVAAAPAGDAADAGRPNAASEGRGFETLGRTLLAAVVAGTNADRALTHLGGGLTLIEAQARIEAEAEAAAEAYAGPPAAPGPRVPGDPTTMPPASAGSNGTSVPRHSAAERAKIFANTRAASDGSTSILLTGIALPPPDAPQAVKDVVNNANMIVGRPYVWGGGHASFYSNSYDCSGAVSFALFGGGMIPRPLTSSELEGWGAPGPGKWITVFANGGHTFAEIAGLRWDTVGDENGTGPRWHIASTDTSGFVVRHPPGF